MSWFHVKRYQWVTSAGEKVVLTQDVIDALAAIDRAFPGAKAVAWRRPGGKWRYP